MLNNFKIFLFGYFIKIANEHSFIKTFLNIIRKLISFFYRKKTYNFNNNYERIYYYHIPKTAGTSVIASFYNNENINFRDTQRKQQSNLFTRKVNIKGKVFTDHNIHLINKGHFYFAWSHYSYQEIKIPKNTFTFTSIREPSERLISYFNFLNGAYLNQENKNFNNIKHLIKSFDNDFDLFLENLDQRYKYSQLYTFSNRLNIEEAIDNIKKLDFITLDSNFEYLNKVILKNFGFLPEIKNENVSIKYYENTIKDLTKEIKLEYEFYNYIKNNIDVETGKLT